jgi:hypothetical protein
VTKGPALREASKPEDLNLYWHVDGGIKAEVVKKLDFIDVHEKIPGKAKMTVSRLDFERADAARVERAAFNHFEGNRKANAAIRQSFEAASKVTVVS